MKKLLILLFTFLLSTPSVFSQKKWQFEVGIDVSPYKNIIGQREILFRLRSETSRLINPFVRFGFGERRFGGGCKIDDFYDKPQTEGWFFRAGNHFRLRDGIFVGPIFMYVSETNSIQDTAKIFQSRKEENLYAGLNLDFTLFERKKWGINFNMSALYALKKQAFWGSSCNDFKMGVGSAVVTPLFINLNTMVYYRF